MHCADAAQHHVDRINFYPSVNTQLYAPNVHDIDHGSTNGIQRYHMLAGKQAGIRVEIIWRVEVG